MSTRLARAGVLCVSGLLAACFQPSIGADELAPGVEPPSDLFAPDASDVPTCPNPDPSPLSMMRVRVRTTAVGGRFAPRNVGAIWIERADGRFVKTLARWGKTRAKWLTRFVAASNTNLVDAITGPTLLSHTIHEVTWNLGDLSRCEIEAGDYQVVFELTDRSGTGESIAIGFAKDQLPTTTTPGDTPYFHDLELVLE